MKTKIYLFITSVLVISIFAAFTMIKSDQVKHVVVFKYKQQATPEQINEVTKAFADLKGKIPGIVSIEYGANISPEKLDMGYTHVYLLTFENVAARDAYLPHPDHKKFGDLLGKLNVLDGKPFVVDFQVAQ